MNKRKEMGRKIRTEAMDNISDFLLGFIVMPLVCLSVLWILYLCSVFLLLSVSGQYYALDSPLRNPFMRLSVIASVPLFLGMLAVIFMNKRKPYISIGAVLGSLLYYLLLWFLFSFVIWQ